MISPKTISIAVFILLVAGAGVFVATRSDNQNQTASDAATTTPTTTITTGPVANNQSAGRYVDYSPQALAEATGQKVLFFHAPWCPQCRSVEKGIKEQGVPAGVTILKVDYDSNQALRQKYGVTIQTTFVKLDDAGNKSGLYVAYEQPTFDAVKQNFLAQ